MTPPVRRVVTGHDAAGRAVVLRDDVVPTVPVATGDARFALMWITEQTPADNNGPVDGALPAVSLSLPGGTVLRIVDILPGCRSPMHSTRSLDYGIVLQGEIVLELEDGVSTVIRAGEVIVQRGTIHAWENQAALFCRIAFILLDATPILVGGVALTPTH